MGTAFMMFIVFILVSIIGWVIAEGKYKIFPFETSEKEKNVLQKQAEDVQKNGYTELSIRDIMKNNSYRGFSAL